MRASITVLAFALLAGSAPAEAAAGPEAVSFESPDGGVVHADRYGDAPGEEPVGVGGAQRLALGELDPHDLGTEIPEDAARHRRRLAREVDDPRTRQQPARRST